MQKYLKFFLYDPSTFFCYAHYCLLFQEAGAGAGGDLPEGGGEGHQRRQEVPREDQGIRHTAY